MRCIKHVAMAVFVLALVGLGSIPTGDAATIDPRCESVTCGDASGISAQGTTRADITVTRTPLDERTGAVIGATVVLQRSRLDASGLHTLSTAVRAFAGSTRGRATFKTRVHVYDGCLPIVGCAFGFDQVDAVDANWYAPWGAVHMNNLSKRVPVNADGFYRYDGQSATFGFDNAHSYYWGGFPVNTGISGLYFRGTAQIQFCPAVGTGLTCVTKQIRIIQRIHSNGTWNSSYAVQ